MNRSPILVGLIAVLWVSPAVGQVPKPVPKSAPKSAPKAATAAKKPPAFKTPWGDPDLQGVWNDATSTPLQRPWRRGNERRTGG